MKNSFVTSMAVLTVASFLLAVSSCDTGGDHHPYVGFWVDGAITFDAQQANLPRDTVFNISVNASQPGGDGLLRSFKISISTNGSADSTILQADFYTKNFDQTYSYIAGDSGDIQLFTFTAGNDEGLFRSITFTDTAY